jgi:hypothetical protein
LTSNYRRRNDLPISLNGTKNEKKRSVLARKLNDRRKEMNYRHSLPP